jgi:uncharacterized protein (TIRG00374 family)
MAKNRRLDQAREEVTRSLKLSRIIIPVLIGIGVVAYLLWQQFDPAEFAKINWTFYTLVWLSIAAGLLVIRHLAYAMRLWLLSDKFFTFKKCIKLIFLWEFSSAITPTAVGGSAVALFVISKEKLSFARTTTIVLHTVVLDTLFFVGILPILFLLFGSSMIRPEMESFMDVGGWGYTFIITYLLMAGYGTFFYYGLFRNPNQLKRLLVIFTYNRFLKRYRQNAIDLGNDIILASKELARKNFGWHLRAFSATVVAWCCKFLVLMALINGIVPEMDLSLENQSLLFSRVTAMLVIMAFSPTPGGSGFAEYVFGGFLSDFVPKGIALVIATIWRLMAYYSYLLAGAIILPAWIQTHIHLPSLKKSSEDKSGNPPPENKVHP